MRKFLNTFPLHTFLFVFFISFFLYAQNPELVDLSAMKRTLIYGTFACVLLFFIFYLFYRNKLKAGITTTLILLVLFNYGLMYDGLERLYYDGLWPFANIHRYLLGFSFLLCCGIILFVHKKINQGTISNYFLNLLVILLLLFNITKVLFLNHASEKEVLSREEKSDNNGSYPDIYYIVLDGYANQHVLKKYYNYDNSEFLLFLEQQGFYLADSAFSNYYSTMSSLSGTFNLDYHQSLSGDVRRKMLRNNMLFQELKQKGYRLYNMESGYSVTSRFPQMDSTVTINSPNEFERSILKFTIFRIDEVLGIIQHSRLKSQVEKINSMAAIGSGKKFVFIHMVAPHPPFVFNSKGERVFDMKNHDNYWEPKEHYINQLIYVNTVIKSFITEISKIDNKAIVILQSDHGPWIANDDADARFESRSMILNAMKLPGVQQDKLYRHISSVNTFRLVKQQYFDSSCKLLPDLKAGKSEIMESIFFLKDH
ncbi:MAG: sulfatase-like hydrolase/transferase [Bacteroidota bacterium]